MKRILFALATVAEVSRLHDPRTWTGEGTGAIFVNEVPPGYRDWRLISVSHLTAGKLSQLRSRVGKDIAITAYQDGKLHFLTVQ